MWEQLSSEATERYSSKNYSLDMLKEAIKAFALASRNTRLSYKELRKKVLLGYMYEIGSEAAITPRRQMKAITGRGGVLEVLKRTESLGIPADHVADGIKIYLDDKGENNGWYKLSDVKVTKLKTNKNKQK